MNFSIQCSENRVSFRHFSLIIMRSFLLFLIIGLTTLHAENIYSQNTININVEGVSFEQLFKEIQKKSNFIFFYKDKVIPKDARITLKKKNVSVEEILDTVFSGKNLNYKVDDRQIIIFSKKPSSLKNHSSIQQVEVSGTVVDGNGIPLPGATIMEKGTNNGTQSDFDGHYKLKITQEDAILIISFMGYKTKEIPFNGQSEIDVVLSENTSALDEVVLVGYGTQKKVSMTSAVSTISKDELVERPSKSLGANLQGLAPGLTVIDNGGAPGNPDLHLLIRGVTTLGNTNPLVIVDGIERNIDDVDPNNIESISILKDAASTAIYGSRGANGVILITTKRGEKGKIKITYNASYELQNITIEPEHLDTEAYLRLENTAYENRGSQPLYSEEEIQHYVSGDDRLHYPEPNVWYDRVIRDNAPMQRHSLSISGGNENLRSNLMTNYFQQDGIFPNQDYNEYRVRLNNDLKVFKDLNLSADLSLFKGDRYTFINPQGVYGHLTHGSQLTVPIFPDGTYGLSKQKNNPLAESNPDIVGNSDNINYNAVVNFKGEWYIMDNLKATSQYAVNLEKDSRSDNVPTFEIRDYFNKDNILKSNSVNELYEVRSEALQTTWNNTINYSPTFGFNEFNLLLGYSEISYTHNKIQATGYDFYNNELRDLNLGDPLRRDLNSSYSDWGLRSFFGRLNYTYNDKYIVEFNMRYDGSSRFPKGNRYTFFPSLAAAWRISEEAFWNPIKPVVNEFKIRGSWGRTGNQNVGLYEYYEKINLANYYVFNENPVMGARQVDLASKDLTWETTEETDIGFDLSFLHNKINTSFDWFTKTTNDILLNLPIPAVVGLNPSATNAGSVENKGWEAKLNYRNFDHEFKYSITANISDVKNKILNLAGTGPYYSGIAHMFIRQEGGPIDALYGWKTDGFLTQEDLDNEYPTFSNDATVGDIKYVDRSGPDGVPDEKITQDDRTILGSTIPRLTFGASLNMAWKNFDFNMQLQGVGDKELMLYGALVEGGSWEGFTVDLAGDYWTPENTDARFPRPQKQANKNTRPSDWWLINGAYLRLKNFQLGYSLPDNIINHTPLNRLRFFIGGTNLLTFSELNDWGLDAEAFSGRGTFYPPVKTFTFGVNLGL